MLALIDVCSGVLQRFCSGSPGFVLSGACTAHRLQTAQMCIFRTPRSCCFSSEQHHSAKRAATVLIRLKETFETCLGNHVLDASYLSLFTGLNYLNTYELYKRQMYSAANHLNFLCSVTG